MIVYNDIGENQTFCRRVGKFFVFFLQKPIQMRVWVGDILVLLLYNGDKDSNGIMIKEQVILSLRQSPHNAKLSQSSEIIRIIR